MIINVTVSGYYDWEPLPDSVEPTEQDIKKQIVKPSGNGGWLARIKRTGETHTTVSLPEGELAAQIVRDAIKEKVVRTRSEGAALYLSRHVMQHHAHKSWMRGFEISDDGPDVAMFEKLVDEHIAAGNLEDEDKSALMVAYAEPLDANDHTDHLHVHFGVKKKSKHEGAV
jgi:hypothetical protein